MLRLAACAALFLLARTTGAVACGGPATPVHEVQGAGETSPLGATSVTVQGVVTAAFPGLDGYFLQQEEHETDSDPATSEGVFVHHPGATTAAGERLRVTGTVTEFHGLTELARVSDWERCGRGALPAPVELTLPVDSLAAFEAVEGMRVHFPGELVLADGYDLLRYGELLLSSSRLFQPTELADPGPAASTLATRQALGTIQLDDGSGATYPDPPSFLDRVVRAGDAVSGVTGVLGFSFGQYELHPTEYVAFAASNPRPTEPPDPGGAVRVASFNVGNYFLTLDTGESGCGPGRTLACRGAKSAPERERQREKLRAALRTLAVDVVALLEVENDDGAAVADLAGALGHAFVDTGSVGTDAIRVALLYDAGSVEADGPHAWLDSSVDERFDDRFNRPVLAQTFRVKATGERFTVAVNHLKSKGSACDELGDPDVLDGQGNCNQTRLRAVEAELDWLARDPTGSGLDAMLVVGDFNAYTREDPIRAFERAGYSRLGNEGTYSYLFQGRLGTLDHAFASGALASRVAGFGVWHINADELPLYDYRAENPATAYDPGPFRSSDHDPILIGLFPVSERPQAAEPTISPPVKPARRVRLGNAGRTARAGARESPAGSCTFSGPGDGRRVWLGLFVFWLCAAAGFWGTRRLNDRRGR